MTALAALLSLSLAAASSPRTISFSGYSWEVRSTAKASGPGPNVFSDSARNVWLDEAGALHLRIARDGERWTCAEVTLAKPLGYGTYTLRFGTPVGQLDDASIFGYFTWSGDRAQSNREMDVELSKWADPANRNAQFVVVPADEEKRRFDVPASEPRSSYTFVWKRHRVLFSAEAGGRELQRWDFASATVPDPKGARVKLNLWLYRGKPPLSGRELEVVVEDFSFQPQNSPRP